MTERLRVLMYHSVSGNGCRDGLTVDNGQLEQHFRYLLTEGYTPILLSDLLEGYTNNTSLPENPVLITFDDGYRNNYEIAYPLAEKYQVKMNLFLVPSFIIQGRYKGQPTIGLEDIRRMDPGLVEIGLHSFGHRNYSLMDPAEIEKDLDNCFMAFRHMDIDYQPCLAYPYGAWPKGPDQDLFLRILQAKGIRLAFRIGNRLNTLPLRQPFLIQRIDVRGDESFRTFRLAMSYGKKSTGWLAPLLR